MGRPHKPWLRKDSQTWVVKIKGKQYTLAKGKKNRAEAIKAFHELMASIDRPPTGDTSSVTVGSLADYFLTWSKNRHTAGHYERNALYVRSWVEFIGRQRLASSISHEDVERWFASVDLARQKKGKTDWSPSTKQTVIEILRRQYGWGMKHKPPFVFDNPLRDLVGPGYEQREATLDAATVAKILAATKDHPVRHVIEFMWETGCRPSEAYWMEIKHVNMAQGVVIMASKTTRVTKKKRVIYLTPRAKEIVAAMIAAYGSGPVFRRDTGKPWDYNAVNHIFGRLRAKLGLGDDCMPEALRHGFGTDGALHLPPMVLAGLMGHSGTKMLERYYVDLSRRKGEMHDAASTVRPAPPAEASGEGQDASQSSAHNPSEPSSPQPSGKPRKTRSTRRDPTDET